MNEELQTRLTSYLDAIESHADTAGEFVVEQTPLVAQEYLAWVFWSSTFQAATAILLAIAVLIVAVFAGREEKRHMGFPLGTVLFAGFFLIGSLSFAVHYSLIAAKVTIAPRVVLLEKVSELMP